ncbi:MAG: hypothetical protein Q8Q14_01575 [Gemmatimonadales bacterium]|nr:hypothetical protein [Gemmatimonadales bacterium]
MSAFRPEVLSPRYTILRELGRGGMVAYADRRGWLAYFTVNPILDSLRGHPRFEALRAKMQLTP